MDPPKSDEVLYHMHDSGESPDVSICHTVSSMNSPSACQSHDSSVSQPSCDSIWKSVHPSVCLSSIPSIRPSAKFTVKIPRSIAQLNFLNVQILGKFSSVRTSLNSSVDPSGSPSSTLSTSVENPLKFPRNNGRIIQ